MFTDKGDLIRISQALWPSVPSHEFGNQTYLSWFEFIGNQSSRNRSMNEPSLTISLLFNNDNAFKSRDNAVKAIRSFPQYNSNTEATIRQHLDAALGTIFTLNIRTATVDTSVGASPAQAAFIKWDNNSTLAEAIEAHFDRNRLSSASMKSGKIDPSLSIPYLCHYRGWRVFWTSNLAEHLSFNWKYRIVTIYEHKIVLWNYLESYHHKPARTSIPRPILEEAIDTLNLLFPLDDPLTKTFLKQHGKAFHGLGYCSRPRDQALDLARFSFWRERIAELAEVMNEKPRGMKQLVLDRDGKNLLSFVTFWVAAFAAVLAILSIPLAAVSMVYSMRQYWLSLAQACSGPEAKELLPQYCGGTT